MARNAAAYDEDFVAWTVEQARLLRAGELSALDAKNLAEEIEDMGRSFRHQLDSRLAVLVMHLLKWSHQPNARARGWLATIHEQRRRIAKLLRESPSLRPSVAALLPEVYETAREHAIAETGLPDHTFPLDCPFSEEQILAKDFLPE